MAFYKLGYKETLALPLRAFWFMDACIDRIEAQHQRDSLSVVMAANSEEAYESFVEDLDKRIGEVVKVNRQELAMHEKLDEEGLNELRNMTF